MKALPIILLLTAGCCSVSVSKEGDRDLVEIKSEGWKLLNCIPIASGDPDYPNQEVASWFTDNVTLATNMRLLDETLRERGYRNFRDLTSFKADETVIPLLFKRYAYHTSAEMLK